MRRESLDLRSPDPFEIIRTAPQDRPFVVAQLGQSLDGRIATVTGESRWINGDAALDHVHMLRAVVDAVVVGVGTAVADDPLLTVRRVPGSSPARVVIDPNGRLPGNAKCLNEDGVRRIILRSSAGTRAPAGETFFFERKGETLCPREIIQKLFGEGIRKILVEGGARTISNFINADCLDRLHVLVAPVIIGSGKPGLDLAPIQRLSMAKRPRTTPHLLDGGEVLFDCDMKRCL